MNSTLRSFLTGGEGGASPLADAGLLLLRLFTGLALAFGHGLGKLPPSAGFIETTGNLGFPLPTFFAWAAGLTEFVGGLCLAFGLGTRPAAVLIAFTMAVAAFGQHGGDPFSGMEKSLLFLVIAVVLFLTGSGRYGLDRLLQPKDNRIWR
ncbi:MAG: DoxX family protein [Rhodothermaceae bacterium]|nr:DoxX family protein [Rhodothermaceae bacterium]